MACTPSWTNQDQDGHVLASQWLAAGDVNELASAVNRRLKVMFDPGQPDHAWPMDFAVSAGQPVASGPLASARTGFEVLVPDWSYFVHGAGWDQLALYAYWLCPRAGPDENKLIVPDDRPPGAGEVGFFALLNGATGWTGAVSGLARAGHVNEPRDAAVLLSRGRYRLRVGDGGGARASRDLPGGLWYPPAVARDGTDEMHSWFGGRQWLWPTDGAGGHFGTRGQSVAVRSATMRLRPLGDDVRVRLYHCKRNVNPADFSWTEYDGAAHLAWATPGGTGPADAGHIEDFDLADNAWTEYQDASFTELVQDMADGQAEPTFMLAPNEQTGWGDDPVHIEAELVVDFDLNAPPA